MAQPDLVFNSVRDYLKSVEHEAMKLYRTYDAGGRLLFQYECPTNTLDGGACLRTQYGYSGTTSLVIQMKETLSNWSGTWDL